MAASRKALDGAKNIEGRLLEWRGCSKISRFDADIASSLNGGKTTPHQHWHFDEVVALPRRLDVLANSLHLSDDHTP